MPVTDRARELIQKSLEAIASESEAAELERLLASDPHVALALANAARLNAGLTRHFRKQQKLGEIAALLGKSPAGAANPTSGSGAADSNELTTGDSADFNISDIDLRQFDPGHIDPAFAATGPQVSSYKARDSKVIRLTRSRGHRRMTKYAWKWAAVGLVLLVGAFFWSWWENHPRADRIRVVAGQIAVATQEVVEVPLNVVFEVIGDSPATLELPGGARLELKQATRGTLSKSTQQAVYQILLTLEAGSGTVTAPHDGLPFRIHTAIADVTTQGRVSLNLTIGEPSPTVRTPGGGRPGLHVAVLEGTAMLEQAGAVMWLKSGEQKTLFSLNPNG